MKPRRPVLPIALALTCAAALASAQDFSVVALPDTQHYSQDYPEIYDAQTQWIVNNVAARNIEFVTHLGDLVDQAGTISQWQNAFDSMSILDDANVPYGTSNGNHDFLYPGTYYDPAGTNYLAYFDPARFASEPWWGGASPSGLSNHQVIQVGGQDYLFLHLALETPAAELAWAQGVLNANQDKPTWISTHRYLFDWTLQGAFPFVGAGRYDDFNYFFEPLYRHDGIKADDFYASFVAANRQVYLVACGHNHAEYRQTSTNNFGLTVHEVLADYQDEPNGGDGWLRISTFRPQLDRIEVESYSPTRDEFRTGSESQFDLSVDFDAYPFAAGDRLVSFQQGVAGYEGTEDTWINEDASGSSYGNANGLVVDDDTTNSLFAEEEGQALLRFDSLFQAPVSEGDPAPDRIPLDATLVSASLILHLSDDENIGDTTIRVHQLSTGFSESSTWSSLGGGIQVGSETAGQVGTFQGDNDPDNDYSRTIEVASAIEAWRGGATNHGLAILRDQTDFNDDGIEIHSSEAGDSALRPKLSVLFSYPTANVGPSILQALHALPATVDEGSEVNLVVEAGDPNPLDPLVFSIEGQDVGFATGAGTITHKVLMEDEGSYPFSATVRDDSVTIPAGSTTVIVNNVAPMILDIQADLLVDVDRVFDYWVDAADPGPLDVVAYAWDLDDDGNRDDATTASGETWLGQAGTFVLSVEVSDDDGGSSVGTFLVQVVDLPPDGDFDSDGSAIAWDAFVDPDDAAAFAFCIAGNGATPSPPPPYSAANCLSAFDIDGDGDVNLQDEGTLLSGMQPPFVPTRGWAVILAAFLMALSAFRLLAAEGRETESAA